MTEATIAVHGEQETKVLAEKIGAQLKGGEVFELIGDVGAGKTTFTKGLARGLAIDEDVQSPSFTISRTYEARDGLQLVHYDFYRLQDPGIMANELQEVVNDTTSVTVIEWADIVDGVLPEHRITLSFEAPSETERRIHITNLPEGILL